MWISDVFNCLNNNLQLFLNKQKEYIDKHNPPNSIEEKVTTVEDLHFKDSLSKKPSSSSQYNYLPPHGMLWFQNNINKTQIF